MCIPYQSEVGCMCHKQSIEAFDRKECIPRSQALLITDRERKVTRWLPYVVTTRLRRGSRDCRYQAKSLQRSSNCVYACARVFRHALYTQCMPYTTIITCLLRCTMRALTSGGKVLVSSTPAALALSFSYITVA